MKRLLLCSLVVCGMCTILNGEFIGVRTYDALQRVLWNNEFVIVYAYTMTEKQEQAFQAWEEKAEQKEQKQDLPRVAKVANTMELIGGRSDEAVFEEAGIPFVGAGLHLGDLDRFQEAYDVTSSDTLLFFKNQKVQYKMTRDDVFVPKETQKTFIFGEDEVDTFLHKAHVRDFAYEQRKEMRREERKRRKAKAARRKAESRYYNRPSVSFGFGYPHYGSYSHIPYYHWPYARRYHHYPHAGFGFGFHL